MDIQTEHMGDAHVCVCACMHGLAEGRRKTNEKQFHLCKHVKTDVEGKRVCILYWLS